MKLQVKYIIFALIFASSSLNAEYVCPPCDPKKVYVSPLKIIEGMVTGTGMRSNGSHYILVGGITRLFADDADDAIAAGLEYGDNVIVACTNMCWLWSVEKKTQ